MKDTEHIQMSSFLCALTLWYGGGGKRLFVVSVVSVVRIVCVCVCHCVSVCLCVPDRMVGSGDVRGRNACAQRREQRKRKDLLLLLQALVIAICRKLQVAHKDKRNRSLKNKSPLGGRDLMPNGLDQKYKFNI